MLGEYFCNGLRESLRTAVASIDIPRGVGGFNQLVAAARRAEKRLGATKKMKKYSSDSESESDSESDSSSDSKVDSSNSDSNDSKDEERKSRSRKKRKEKHRIKTKAKKDNNGKKKIKCFSRGDTKVL